MVRPAHSTSLSAIFLAFFLFAGCSDAGKAPPRFQIDPDKAAQEAMQLYDKNGDGKLDAKELAASPPLEELLLNLKTREPSHADTLTADDIRQRIDDWLKSPAILQGGVAMVSLDGKPLADAKVSFEPEPFLGASYHAHSGTTNAVGMCDLDPELADYPHNIYVGLYRIRISKVVGGKETIPERFNTQTTLGREIAGNVRNARGNVMFSLQSK